MSIFKGFNIQYPSYTVVCPQSGYSFQVRGLNVYETAKMKGSIATPSKVGSIINNTLWSSIQEKPDHIKTYDDFVRFTTTQDREALLYALYIMTFGNERKFDVKCSSCQEDHNLKIRISDIFSMEAYPYSPGMKSTYKVAKAMDKELLDPEIESSIIRDNAIKDARNNQRPAIPNGMPPEIVAQEFGNISDEVVDELDLGLGKKPEPIQYVEEAPVREHSPAVQIIEPPTEKVASSEDIFAKRVVIELPVSKIVVTIKQPTIYDEELSTSIIPFGQQSQVNVSGEIQIIEKFEQFDPRYQNPVVTITEREDILYGYQSLPTQDKMKIFEEYNENFGKYGVKLESSFKCKKCDFQNRLSLNITEQLFRLIATT